jgi:hypothetical protein
LIPLHDEVATIKELFVQETSLHDHYATAQKDTALYVATVILLLYRGVEISKGSTCLSWLLRDTVLVSSDPTSYFHSWVGRAKLLATLWCLKYYDVADYLLATYKEVFALPEVLRALQLLDSGRRIRAIEKKIARLETQNTVKGHKINILKGQINDLKKEASIGMGTKGANVCDPYKRREQIIMTMLRDVVCAFVFVFVFVFVAGYRLSIRSTLQENTPVDTQHFARRLGIFRVEYA